jgi:hypothetical protein
MRFHLIKMVQEANRMAGLEDSGWLVTSGMEEAETHWAVVDLEKRRFVYGVQSAGSTSKYKFSASFDGIDWTPVDNAYVFDANFDGSTTVTRGDRLLNRSLWPRSVSCAWREENIELF